MKEITTTELCHHCHEEVAKFISIKQKLCCENNVAKCPAVRKKIGKANKDILLSVDGLSGLTKAKAFAKEKKEKAEFQNELDPYKLAAQKMVKTRIDNDSYTSNSEKALRTKRKVGNDGLTIIERSTQKMLISRNKKGADGLTNFERAANKSTQTRLNDIDDMGRNGFDRMWIKAGQAKVFNGTSIYYRSSYEKKFLESLVGQYGLSWVAAEVKNPKSVPYTFDNRNRKYIPDFLIDGIFYEIKSSYTWDDFGNNTVWLMKNLAKLESLHVAGYTVILVLDGVEHIWKNYRGQYEILG